VGRKRPERTERRARERDARQLVRDREKLAKLVAGGAREHPLEVTSAAVIEGRATALGCAQCEGEYQIVEHRSGGAGVRAVDVRCRRCGVPRTLWFRIISADAN
jgi:predicted Zn finger-like uncharacterized protein